ncbi:MAG: hypothetical protein HC878_09770 [Leptolyngbyaceae cyanobacterium SL_5_14]|nr:hypothetical protein [Leptolyngbyaceae cyanobacterium SL_5_14]
MRAGVNIFEIKAETEGAFGVHTLGFETLDSRKAVYDRRTPAQKDGANLRPGEVIRFSLGLPYIEIDGSRFPYAARHVRDVLRRRQIFTIDRSGAERRRALSRRNYLRVQNGTPNPNTRLYQYDEAPPAVFLENAGRGHVRVIPQRDNGGAGSSLGQQLNNYGSDAKRLDNGWKVQFWATPPSVSTPSIVPDVPILWP